MQLVTVTLIRTIQKKTKKDYHDLAVNQAVVPKKRVIDIFIYVWLLFTQLINYFK